MTSLHVLAHSQATTNKTGKGRMVTVVQYPYAVSFLTLGILLSSLCSDDFGVQ